MTAPDLDALAALLDKATPDAVFAFSADELSALLAYVRELESYCAGYKKMIDAVTDPAVCEAAADALERLARERDDIRTVLQNTNRAAARLANIAYKYKWQVRDTCTRAERAEAERDALREVVRAADAMADAYYPDPFHHAPPLTVDAYNAARAKVNTTEGEK